MKAKGAISIIRWVALGFIFIATLLTVIQLVTFSRIRSALPAGLLIANIPVGGLDSTTAAQRLDQAYNIAVELHYNDAVIQLKPSVVDFKLDVQSMLAAADMQRNSQPFWSAFWDYLWNRQVSPAAVPLRATLSEERLRSYLKDEIAARYDKPASVAMPVPGSTIFKPGSSGSVLDVDRAVMLIHDAMFSPNARVVNLSYNSVNAQRPSLQNLQILLQQVIDVSGFDGLTELYLMDISTGQELHFAYKDKATVQPDVAFTAASTMKIPIMVSVFKREKEPLPADVTQLMELMIERSENTPADSMMQTVMDPNLGPLEVTQDLQALGFQDTFLAGYFYPGAPLLKNFQTPANQRTDINTNPDVYNQTTPAEMGMLLDDVYQCAEDGGGAFAAVFPGQISQAECRQMITYLARNRIGVLLQAGLPEGTQIAHKHGWITEADGLIHAISDAGIVYTPGGNYILTVYMYHPTQLLFDPANLLMANLSSAVYNYYNLTK